MTPMYARNGASRLDALARAVCGDRMRVGEGLGGQRVGAAQRVLLQHAQQSDGLAGDLGELPHKRSAQADGQEREAPVEAEH